MPDHPNRLPTAERSQSPLWREPVIAGVAALVVALAAAHVRPHDGAALSWLPSGDHDSARALLQVTATSVMTATTLTFSLTVVTLQLASQQFSPRLLREFTRDPVTKAVLSVLAATFVFSTAGLVLLDAAEPVPRLTVVLAEILALASLVAVLALITHVVRIVRVDTMMLMVHDETSTAIATFYPPYGDQPAIPVEDLDLDGPAPFTVVAHESGFLQRTDPERLVDVARQHGAFLWIDVRAGDHVVQGVPIGRGWFVSGPGGPEEERALADEVRAAMTFGYERTLDQDSAFGFRQLEDIAVKAMSPSVNDPVTAAHAVGHMGDLLVRLVGRRLGPTVHQDEAGAARALVPDRDLRYYLDLACSQLRRFGSDEPTVLAALLRMLRDVAVACRDDTQRAEVRRARDLILKEAALDDEGELQDLADRVERALVGDVLEAYWDRVGETRSI